MPISNLPHKDIECNQGILTKREGRLSTVDLLIKVACFVKEVKIFSIQKGADLNWLVQGGQLYSAFPFSKTSLM